MANDGSVGDLLWMDRATTARESGNTEGRPGLAYRISLKGFPGVVQEPNQGTGRLAVSQPTKTI